MCVRLFCPFLFHCASFFLAQTADGEWMEDEEQTVRLKADFVISAFGSELGNKDGRLIWPQPYKHDHLSFVY